MKKKPAKIAYDPDFIGWPKPMAMWAYYTAVAVAVISGLLILHGALCAIGFVDYSPILK